ncbi:hypothetical protein Rsub_08091 [Raphidocelis subcapitata]|uniref:RRM domain-containing protein n=1 Tax=Raphidocelis subcapitata TaxID=307507 RepID=A0A2V0P7X7_9CHLO|nr:hypothetical protein Rsub_08091 [Raphidocelis subcapitata]|eukprot:GBF95968.1 hypothetical protein Rsub_08091 [Raphidocelis subcapitata]
MAEGCQSVGREPPHPEGGTLAQDDRSLAQPPTPPALDGDARHERPAAAEAAAHAAASASAARQGAPAGDAPAAGVCTPTAAAAPGPAAAAAAAGAAVEKSPEPEAGAEPLAPPPPEGRQVFFAKVPPSASPDEVAALFARFGGVESVNLFRAWATARSSKGCGLVTMATAAAAAAAREALNGSHVWPGAEAAMVVEWYSPGKLGTKAAAAAAVKAAAAAGRGAERAAAAGAREHGGGGGGDGAARRRGPVRGSVSFTGPGSGYLGVREALAAGGALAGAAFGRSASFPAAAATAAAAASAAAAAAGARLDAALLSGGGPPSFAPQWLCAPDGSPLCAGPQTFAALAGRSAPGPAPPARAGSDASLAGGLAFGGGLLGGSPVVGGGGGSAGFGLGGAFRNSNSDFGGLPAGDRLFDLALAEHSAAAAAAAAAAWQFDGGGPFLPAAPDGLAGARSLGSAGAAAGPCFGVLQLAAGASFDGGLAPSNSCTIASSVAATNSTGSWAFPSDAGQLSGHGLLGAPQLRPQQPHGAPQLCVQLTPAQAEALRAHVSTLAVITGCAVAVRPAAGPGPGLGLGVPELVVSGTPPQLQSASVMVARLLATL